MNDAAQRDDSERHKRGDDAQAQERRGDDESSEPTSTASILNASSRLHSASSRSHIAASRVHLAASSRTPAAASRWRLFCAIELPEELRNRAVAHIAHLREQLPDVRASWERTEKLHITLKFFGDIEESRAHALSQAIERSANSAAPFTLDIAGARAFPTHGPPRVIWLGLRDAQGQLARLHESLESECAAAGFARDERRFHPHITLARLRPNAGARDLATLHRQLGFPAHSLHVNELVLMRSELGPKGSRYTVVSHHGLVL